MMKRFLLLVLVLAFVAAMAVGCSGGEQPAGEDSNGSTDDGAYADGVYFAQDDSFGSSGYKGFVVITVEGGKVTDAEWGETNIQPIGNKKTYAEEGKYGMNWDVQAEAAEAWLVENQDPAQFDDLYTDEEGHTEALTTDAGTAVSIHVMEFFELAKKALDSDPVQEGEYNTPDDFVATASIPVDTADPEYDPNNAWEYRADFVVVNGTIMSANYNAVFAGEFNDDTAKFFAKNDAGEVDETQPLSKVELGMDYGMDWKANAEKADAFVVEKQGFPVEYTDDAGHTDSITGVSIHVKEFEELFKTALGV